MAIVRVAFILLVVCCLLCDVDACGRRRRRRRRSPPRDTRPPVLTCPPNIHTVADPYQVNAKVTWNEPKAYDNEMKKTVKTTRSGLAPGKLFREGRHRISYSARDNMGNYASCSFYIYVRVVKCHRWSTPSDGWKVCHPSDEMRYGGSCRFGCYPGHDLVGASRTTCQRSGSWTVSNSPYCKKKTCGPLFPSAEQLDKVTIQCTDGVNYRSKCYYVCEPGYCVTPGHSKVVVCGVYGHWVGKTPICKDALPPEFSSCPVVKTVYAERTMTSGRANWTPPNATDNSGDVDVVQTAGPSVGDQLDVGEYDVDYTAIDPAGNTATCRFKLVVKQIVCAEIFPLPYTSVTCPDGRIYGASCQFECDNGTATDLPLDTTCDKKGTRHYYGLWNFGDYQPYCEQTNSCPALPAPGNGALACDTWLDGQFCQMMCEYGYDVPDPPGADVHANMLVCGGTSGTWHVSGDIPDCTKLSKGAMKRFEAKIPYGYYNGSCENATDEIRANFLLSFAKLGWECEQPQCNVENVKVICGERDTRDIHGERFKRDTSTAVAVEISVAIPGDTSIADVIAKREGLKKALPGAKIIIGGQDLTPGAITVGELKIQCPEGHVLSGVKCLECGPGSYQDATVEPNVCRKCDIGWFQQSAGQASCQVCPSGMTTEKLGARECKEACPRGQYSQKGTPPCSPCDIGKYSGVEGTRQCTLCPGSETTNKAGSTSQDACFEFDVVLSGDEEDGEFEAPSVVANMTSSSKFSVSMWLKCAGCAEVLSLTGGTGAEFLTITGGDTLTTTLGGSTSLPAATAILASGIWRYVYVAWTPKSVALYLDGELVTSGSHSLALPETLNVAFGGPGFTGSVSQLNMLSSVTDGEQARDATCFSGELGDLVSWRQYANLDGSFSQIRSKCDAFDNCLSTPCQNGGTCSDAIGGFTCACAVGYSGSDCSVDIDDCVESTCDNDGTCVDGVDSFSCACPHGFSGDLCETQVVDGEWGEYGNWSLCSVTCGTGQQVRNRTCDNPEPSNGGENCTGLSFDTKECEMEPCVYECDTDPVIENGQSNCTWDEDDTRRCSPVCDAGYDFDDVSNIDPPNINCGPETGNTWNYKTPENPRAQLAQCREIKNAKSNTGVYSGTYPGAGGDVKALALAKATENAGKTSCVKQKRCVVDKVIVDATQNEGGRRKRSTSSVTFSISLSCDVHTDVNECYDLLEAAMVELNDLVNSQGYTVTVNGVDYDVDVNSTDVDGSTVCNAGSVPVFQYCIPCGEGMYENGEFCERCAVGFYQDEAGQQTCKQCPEGWTTQGLQTRNVSLCNVADPSDDLEASNIVMIACAGVTGVVVLALIAVIVAYCKLKKKRPSSARSTTPVQAWDEDRAGDFNGNRRFQNRPHTPSHLFMTSTPMPLYAASKKKVPIGIEVTDVDGGPLPSKDDRAGSSSGIGHYDNPLYDDNE